LQIVGTAFQLVEYAAKVIRRIDELQASGCRAPKTLSYIRTNLSLLIDNLSKIEERVKVKDNAEEYEKVL
jgi:hypothetical protein